MSVYTINGLKALSDNFRHAKDGLWAQLTSNETEIVRVRSIIEEGLALKVGNGESIMFSHDKWCEFGPLKVIFPRIYSLSTQKNLFIHQKGSW